MTMSGNLEDGVSWTHGRHNFKFGGQWWRQIIKTFYAGNNGQLGLDGFRRKVHGIRIRFGGQRATVAQISSLVSLFQFGRGVSTGKTWEQSSNVIGIYAQDTWRVTDRLTLNLGLRYDAHTPWVESHNQQANYNFATGNIDLAGKAEPAVAFTRASTGVETSSRALVSPGLPQHSATSTVIRGAFTISSYLEGTGTNLRLTLNPPFTPAEINAATTMLHCR